MQIRTHKVFPDRRFRGRIFPKRHRRVVPFMDILSLTLNRETRQGRGGDRQVHSL